MSDKITFYYPCENHPAADMSDEEGILQYTVVDEDKEEIGFTIQENDLLNKMAAGEIDGIVGEPRTASNGVTRWLVIQSGIPRCYFEMPSKKELVNGEIQRTLGMMFSVDCWETEERKLCFLKTYGKEIKDDDVQAYAAKSGVTNEITKKPWHRILIDWEGEEYSETEMKVYPLDITKKFQ